MQQITSDPADEYAGFGVWRDLDTGVDPVFGDPTLADGALDQPGIPMLPVYTRPDGPNNLPWFEGIENPYAETGLMESPNPTYPQEDVGAQPIVGAYEGAYRTHGPVRAWGMEPSGGWYGDQAFGRIMRFPANIPDRYDPFGVQMPDYRDELAASIAANNEPIISDAEVTTSLLLYPDYGWQ